MAFQKGLQKARRKTARRIRGYDTEERTARRHPWQRSLQHTDEQIALTQFAHDQGSEGPIDGKVGAKQNAVDVYTGVEEMTTKGRRNVEHGDRFANQR